MMKEKNYEIPKPDMPDYWKEASDKYEKVNKTIAGASAYALKGTSPDAETVVNELGGAQSKSEYRTDLVDPYAMFEMCRVLKEGADKYNKYGLENWRNIPVREHLNHLITHVYAFLAGNDEDDHLAHAMCRAMFALGVEHQDQDYIEYRLELLSE